MKPENRIKDFENERLRKENEEWRQKLETLESLTEQTRRTRLLLEHAVSEKLS